MSLVIGFLAGLGVGLWAGRKHALHPQYFPSMIERFRK